jgi:predicted amidohydrolase
MTRNAVFLVHDGEVKGTYFKRRLYAEDGITPGDRPLCFQWEKFSCIPLICADAAYNPSKVGTTMMHEANQVGAGKDVPIIVCSNGGWLMEPYWQVPLQTWASGCDAPVLICGVSGEGPPFIEDGEQGFYGGGGSGVFWPGGQWSDGPQPCQKEEPGIYIVDTDNPEDPIIESARF